MTTVFLRDSVGKLPTFSVRLDGVVLNRRLVEASIAIVHSFVRSPRFTQRDFFSDIGIGLHVSTINAAETIREEMIYDPWANVLHEGYEATVVDLEREFDAVVARRDDARDTSERWFGVRTVELCEVGEPFCLTGVRTSDVVEAGQVEDLSESTHIPDQPFSSSTSVPPRSPGKGKRKWSKTLTLAATPKQLFELDDESMVTPKWRGVCFDDSNFECTSKIQEKTAVSRRSSLSYLAAPVFQSSPR